jgi:hypothetical protein
LDVAPDDLAPIPSDDLFASDFLPDPVLGAIVGGLIEAHGDELDHLHEFGVQIVWKRKGGGSHGRMRRGRCQSAAGLLKHFSDADFIVWIAADTSREVELTNWQLEALVFHELLFASFKEDKDGVKSPAIKPVDFEVHTAELDRYGLWSAELRAARVAFDQLPLPMTTSPRQRGAA